MHIGHGPNHIPSRGVCIYCGASGVHLGDEHVVPRSLGGALVLKGASCRKCEDITKKFEQQVAREMWGEARIAFDAPSKRKRERPKLLSMKSEDGQGSSTRIPAEEFPAGLIFYYMGKAGYLQGLPEDMDISHQWVLKVSDDDDRRERFIQKYKRNPVIGFRHVPYDFGRQLAKIGYGQVLTSLAPSDFTPACLPYILGTKANISYIVGGTTESEPPDQGYGYKLQTAGIGTTQHLILVALVRLYANFHSPEYHVIVGEVQGEEAVAKTTEKLKIELSDVSKVNFRRSTQNSLLHWEPLPPAS